MGLASRLTLSVYVLIPSLSFALLNVSGYAGSLQNAASNIFGSSINPQLALYLLEGLVVALFFVTGELAVLAIRRGAVHDYEEE